MISTRPVLLDVTRLVALGWTGRKVTGIERVCDAYLQHYRSRAQAVVQYRGIVRVLSDKHSDDLFALLANRTDGFRAQMARLAPTIFLSRSERDGYDSKFYINVGHTDFDLQSHWRWIESARLRSIYLLHDVIPIQHPELTHSHAVKRHLGRVTLALLKAAGIIANSQSTIDDIRQFAAFSDARMPPILAAHLGVDHLSTIDQQPAQRGRHFVSLGTIEPRKNHALLLRVWERLIADTGSDPPVLTLIGRWGRQSDVVREMLRSNPRLARHVNVLTNCSDAEASRWIRSASAVLLPSKAEGYGLPLAEAMALGTPVIASDLACFREIGDNIPLLIKAGDDAAWATAITDFLRPGGEADRQRARFSSHRPHSWNQHFQLVDDWMVQNFPMINHRP